MKAVAFDLASPATLADASVMLGQPGAMPMAGGQSLGPMLNLRLARPAVVVRLAGIDGLTGASEDRDAVTLGALVTHAAIADGRAPDPGLNMLARVADGIAYRAVRNRGTIGGSLAHADPAADWLVTLSALGAEMVLAGPHGERVVAMPGFVTGPFQTVLAPDEVITGVRVPKPGAGARWGYWKFTRKIGEFAKASAAVLLDGSRSRIAVGALEQVPILLSHSAVDDPETALHAALPGREPGSLSLHAVAVARAAAIASGTPQ